MLESMTGFSERYFTISSGKFHLILTSLNRHHLDVHLSLPEELSNLELPVRKLIEKKLDRGLITVKLVWEKSSEAWNISIRWDLVRRYMELIKEMESKTGKNFSFSAESIFSLPGILNVKVKEFPDLKKEILKQTLLALTSLKSVRAREGLSLHKDIFNRFTLIKKKLQEIELKYRKKGKSSSEEESRVNIEEEVTRLKAHTNAVFRELRKKHSSGLKLDFLSQEILREANAVSSKIQDVSISHKIIDIKREINSIREQLRNVI